MTSVMVGHSVITKTKEIQVSKEKAYVRWGKPRSIDIATSPIGDDKAAKFAESLGFRVIPESQYKLYRALLNIKDRLRRNK